MKTEHMTGRTVVVTGTGKRADGSKRFEIKQKEFPDGTKELISMNYFDKEGNDVTDNPRLAYDELSDAEFNKMFQEQ